MKLVLWVLIISSLVVVNPFRTFSQDTLQNRPWFQGVIEGSASNLGFYGGIGILTRFKKIGIALSYIKDYSKTNLPFDGPSGLSGSLLFFPSLSDQKVLNHFLTVDYRLSFHERSCSINCDKRYNLKQEVTFGYGVYLKLYKNINLSNSINTGWFVEQFYSDRTGKSFSSYSSNTLIQTRVIVTIKK